MSVAAQQVVEAEAAWSARLDEMRGSQALQQPGCLPHRHPGKGRGSQFGEVWARHQSQQPEQALGVGVQGDIRAVEGGAYCGLRVAIHGQFAS